MLSSFGWKAVPLLFGAVVSVALGAPPALADGTRDPAALSGHRPQQTGKPLEPERPDTSFGQRNRGSRALHAKLGDHDQRLLQRAQASEQRTVTLLMSARRGSTRSVAAAIRRAGGFVGRIVDDLGYVRATVPTGAVVGIAEHDDVLAIDLNDTFRVPDPQPAEAAGTPVDRIAAPDSDTPANNPYLPVGETGAVDFVDAHPGWDGRGVTVGVLDSGVDLDHPALQKTTDGRRKVEGWFAATDPLIDNDATWLQMTRKVTGPSFNSNGRTWTTPAGQFMFAVFYEASSSRSEAAGDLNRDGGTTDRFGVLYDPADHRIWVDSDLDADFTDEPALRPYGVDHQIGHFGVDDPATAVSERMPFVVDYREDVDLSALGGSYVGKVADYVNIGVVAGSHGTHVAGITAGNELFGGRMRGAAPGAQLVSARACTWNGDCTAVALTEGMIDLVVNQHVDVVNVSIGGLRALNDDSDAIARLYGELIRRYGVQIVVSAGNDGPGVNTVSSPSTADGVISVAASVSKRTWWSNYGAEVRAGQSIFGFSSRGPGEDGGLKPTVAAPGSAVSAIPAWLAGQAVPEAGYHLPPGYAMYNGTSMAAPQVTGASALLLSGAKATGVAAPASSLRTALTDTARLIEDLPTAAQGAGLIDVSAAWDLLARGITTAGYDVQAPVCTALSAYLATPGTGKGVYNRCLPEAGGQRVGVSTTYDATVTRLGGAGSPTTHQLSWVGNDGTFEAPPMVRLAQRQATPVRIVATPASPGLHSAILRIDDPRTPGTDQLVPVTVIATQAPAAPDWAVTRQGSVQRGGTESFFVAVPEGVGNLQLSLDGVGDGHVRALAIDPTGMPVDSTSNRCYSNYSDPAVCDPNHRAYPTPMPGVWEFQVEARRTSPLLDNDYRARVALQGAELSPSKVRIPSLSVYRPANASFTATNTWGPVEARAAESQLGRVRDLWSTVADGATTAALIQVPRDATGLDLTLTPRQDDADLDAYLISASTGERWSANRVGPGRERITVRNPRPGTYVIMVAAVNVPSGSTAFDYHERILSPSIGKVAIGDASPTRQESGDRLGVDVEVTAFAEPLNSSGLAGLVSVVNAEGAVIGEAEVLVDEVRTPQAEVLASFAPMVGFDLNNAGQLAGDKQINARTRPVRWTQAGGVEPLGMGIDGLSGTAFDINEAGATAGLIVTTASKVKAVTWHPDGTPEFLGVPDWRPYTSARSFALNDHGTVVGNATVIQREADGRQQLYNDPFVWTATDGFRRLPHLGPNPSDTEPLAINDDGYVVGHSMVDGVSHVALWHPDGTVEDLGSLPGMRGGTAMAINADGVVVGESGDDAFVWTRTGGMRRLPDFGFDATATKVTSDGWIVGTAEVLPDDERPVVWDPQGRIYNLNDMVGQDVMYALLPMGINDSHQVVLYGYVGAASGNALIRLPKQLP
ncbi:S8 family serine peptidase [Micromonospora sp. 4G55]|uniref:S8 family serine peptidase n=1 Tax=Micromonospora sp. 4G55 TaxID=2806102 RepID=UPI001A3C0729|nr:S8 family serine peptidase [Micromonospora sp. 4G55]MBM0256160.1 S8 family serine peptidase [Micromonospora sp. 4G55]